MGSGGPESREGRSIGWNNRSSCRYVSSSSAKVSLTPSLRFLRCKNTHARYRWHETTTVHGTCFARAPAVTGTPCGSARVHFLLLSSRPRRRREIRGGRYARERNPLLLCPRRKLRGGQPRKMTMPVDFYVSARHSYS